MERGHSPVRILIAEDCPDSRMLIEHILKREGYRVSSVENGQECVSEALHAADAQDPFDLVLMDVAMPELDGFAASRQLRDRGFRAPIVAMSTRSDAMDDETTRNAGCDAYVSKLAGQKALVGAVGELLHSQTNQKTSLPTLPIVPAELKGQPEDARMAITFLTKLEQGMDMLEGAWKARAWERMLNASYELGEASLFGYHSFGAALERLQTGLHHRRGQQVRSEIKTLHRLTQGMLAGKVWVERYSQEH